VLLISNISVIDVDAIIDAVRKQIKSTSTGPVVFSWKPLYMVD